jgi:hypothetical protein
MSRRQRYLLALSVFLAAAFTVSAAHATSCSGTLSGSVSDDVVVPSGGQCTVLNATIGGDIDVEAGATLVVNGYLEPTTVGGDIRARHCSSALLEGNVTVGGRVQFADCTGAGPNGFQGPGTIIRGNFECANNAGPCEAWLGNVGGSVHMVNNGGASDVSLVDIGGALVCAGNSSTTHRRGPNWVGGDLTGQCAAVGFRAEGTSIVAPGTPATAGMACASLTALTNFPVPNTTIISATDTAATATLPRRCIVNAMVNMHTSPVDTCTYQDTFQVQLPYPGGSSFGTTSYPAWNGRLMLQGGGGSEGSVPTATGSAGSLPPTVSLGYAVASQDGGHENSQITLCGTKSGSQFYLDPEGTLENAYQSIQVTTLNAKYLIDAYYGQSPAHSYWVGCSTGGRQGMVMSQNFPQYFDGIVAGDPVYDLEKIDLSEIWGVQAIYTAYSTYPGGTVPTNSSGQPIDYAAFPAADQALFTTALLQKCDGLDGTVDGVIDNHAACDAVFNPTTATYTSGGMTFPLQCPGAKNATCLLPDQIQAAMKINQGPRNAFGQTLQDPAGAAAPDHANNTIQGYVYDGGFMTPNGVPTRKIGGPTSTPGDYGLGATAFAFRSLTPPDPGYNALLFNFTTDFGMLNKSTPQVTASTSLDIRRFVDLGHKIIWYHGHSDPGPPFEQTVTYYTGMAAQHGGLEAAQRFSRFYPVPNMGHCGGGPATDQFDVLTPLVQWVENGVAPGPVVASGSNFAPGSAGYGAVNPADVPGAGGPATRSRPLCPYPQEARYIGPAGNSAALAVASNYTCVGAAHKHEGDDDDAGKGESDGAEGR